MNIINREISHSHVKAFVGNCFLCLLSLFFFPKVLLAQQSAQVSVFGSDTTVLINIGGSVDAINTRKYHHETISRYKGLGVENNISFFLENKSDRDIINPRIEINGKRLTYSMADLISQMSLNNLSTIDDTVKVIWHFLCNNYYHRLVSTEAETYQIKPLRTYNVFGAGQCENAAQVICSMLKYLGYRNVFPVTLSDFHTVGLLVLDGRSIVLDPDLRAFYTKRDNKTLADIDSLMWDKELVSRQHHGGVEISEKILDDDIASGYTDLKRTGYLNNYQDWSNPDTMYLRIRPNEQIIFNYDSSVGNYFSFYHTAFSYDSNSAAPPNSSLGIVKYEPVFSSALLNSVSNSENVEIKDSIIYSVDPDKTASLVIDFRNPYVWTNGKIAISYSKTAKGILQISAKKDYQSDYTLLYEADTLFRGNRTDTINLFEFIKPNDYPYRGEPMTNLYYIKIEWLSESTKGIAIDSLYFENNFQLNPNALPRLNLGANTIHITNQKGEAFEGLIYSHTYKEINDYSIPVPPGNPTFPTDGSTISSSQFEFAWELPNGMASNNISDFNIQVSEYLDFRFPVSSTFNKLTSQQHDGFIPKWKIPYPGLLNPNTIYYWRVSVRNNQGIWSDWSNAWKFSIDVTGVPLHPYYANEDDSIVLKWETNPVGKKPSKFYVLGSSERGFSYNDSLIADSTENNFYTIKNASKIFSYAFYRIVAADENNSKSGISDLVAIEDRLLMDTIPSMVQSSDSLNIKMVKIEPVDFYGRSGPPDYTAYSVCDSVVITSLVLPKGLVLENNCIKGKVASHKDSLIEIIGHTYLSGKDIEKRMTFRFNFSPEITGITRTAIRSDSNFRSRIIANDLDGDNIIYSCSNLPQWLMLDSLSGVLSGTPSSLDAGDSYIDVYAKDDKGGGAKSRFRITVWAPSPYFVIESVGDTICKVGQPSVLTTNVFKLPGYSNQVKFQLRKGPDWLSIDSLSGKLFGTPPIEDYGEDFITSVRAMDSNRFYSDYKFQIYVSRENTKPQFLTLPDTICYYISSYKYKVSAVDADTLFGDRVVKYVLLKGPNWLNLDSGGLISGLVGGGRNKYEVIVGAIDAFGDTSLQSFALNVHKEFLLYQNYPNPFSQSTTIRIELPQRSRVRLEILNSAGQRIQTLTQTVYDAGYHNLVWNAAEKSPGIYFAIATINGLSDDKKIRLTTRMLLIK